jgi:1-carboxybiuret hydrolase subunit AtzG-like protein
MAKKRAKTLSKAGSKTRTKTRSTTSRTRVTKKTRAKPSGGGSLDRFVDAAAQALALPVEPAWKPAIKFNLDVTLRMAASFAEFPLPDDAEPAPVFVA